jgi:hypothetical protein
MTTQQVTLQLPEPILRYFRQLSLATHRPLEQLLRQSVEGNLPPSVDTMPTEMRDELLALQTLAVEELSRIAASQAPAKKQARHLELLERSRLGAVSPAEQDELAALRVAADRLMLRKAYAWAVLRWRGYPIPPLAELPLE